MHIEEHKPLAPFTTFGIGGTARWFTRATNEDDIAEAAAWARSRNLPLFVLGGGSNLLVADSGFDGLVLHIALHGIESRSETNKTIFSAAAGEDWDTFVQQTVDANCSGLECLAGIPGTVGGTPVQNVGAYGQEVATTIARVCAFDLTTERFVEFTPEECGFSYRRSRFNTVDRGRFIVSRVDYRLTPGGAPSLRYAELERFFAGKPTPTLAKVAAQVRKIRQGKGMLLVEGDPDCRSAGSFFKNPVVPAAHVAEIALAAGKEPPQYPAGSGFAKIPAAWLIENAGFAKGYARGAAGISSRHTLALINRGGATAADILALAEEIRRAVDARFGVELEMEPVRLGFSA